MEAYRDQYATLFNNGRNVDVIGISVDPDTALASWAAPIHTCVKPVNPLPGTVIMVPGGPEVGEKLEGIGVG